ncbi:MAG TPA: hypothetical protein VGR16_06650 [Thermomicrobiales bacterium]|nr:hypothetical protein [Thermomicrobiales bacterium]
MTRERWITFGSIAATLGGLSWLAKMAVIIATDGEVNDEGAAAFFYILGAALMMIGSTAVGVLLAGRRPRWTLVVAVALSPIFFIISFSILDGVAKPLVGDRGPAYLQDEAGIVTTAVAWLILGISVLNASRGSDGARSIVPVREPSDAGTVMTP